MSCGRRIETEELEEITFSPKVIVNAKYNLYIEKSASMQGYFSKESAKTILTQYIDRLCESDNKNFIDTITFNYIDGKIITPSFSPEKEFINSIYQNCNAKHSKIDDILEKVMSLTDSMTVNIIVSDFIFDSPNINLERAQSGITKTFRSFLNKNNDLSIAIIKYDAEFNGYYYPTTGKLNCNKNRPLYLWAFGPSSHIKNLISLKTKYKKEEVLLLQPSLEIDYQFDTRGKSKRMFNPDMTVSVSDWEKERRSNSYQLSFYADFSNCILTESQVLNIPIYKISPNYSITSIERTKDNIYKFVICTQKPSPCNVRIEYSQNFPNWIDSTNYEGSGIPPIGKTYGVKYLFGGVYDAYSNQFNNLFEINLKFI